VVATTVGDTRVDVKWMSFSGAPALIVPRSALDKWHGFYRLAPDEPPDAGPDFVSADGRAFVICDPNFDAPVTDYDRLCAAPLPDVDLVSIGGVSSLCVADGADSYGWWYSGRMLITNAHRLPTDTQLARATWKRRLVWTIHEPELVLFNACDHGEDVLARAMAGGDDACEPLTLERGSYAVEIETSDIADAARFYRFVRV
jgi:hypothetical protein